VVAAEWLAGRLGRPGLVLVDASWYLPAAARNPRAEYAAGHLPGAVFWDLDALSDPAGDLPHMLPDPERLGREIGALGIGNDSTVVVYDGSGANLSAPRVWWTLRVAGHDGVAVLDGGLANWKRLGLPLEAGTVNPRPRPFRVRFRPELVRGLAAVRAGLGGPVQLLDARSPGRFAGREPEPRPGLRGGHIPGARNLPYGELVDAQGLLLPPGLLRARFEAAGIALDRPVVASCGSGVSACALALALAVLGAPDAAVYDGSWAEWGREGGPPVER
jgi:thiosulfate/3-mercaptopyruvate sulfurtransferase